MEINPFFQLLEKKYENYKLKSLNLDTLDRKWDDYKDNEFKLGKYTYKEKKIILYIFLNYCKKNNFTFDDVNRLINTTNFKKNEKIWTQISTEIPYRSIHSIYNYLKRKFNLYNYKGEWTKDEEKQLLRLYKKHGNKWVTISKIMNRYELNIKDKFRQLGGDYFNIRKKAWNLDEAIKFINKIKEVYNISILKKFNKRIASKLYRKSEKIYKNSNSIKYYNNKLLIAFSPFLNYNLDLNDIPVISWTKLSLYMKTKSYDDCKNFFNTKIWISIKSEIILKSNEKKIVDEINDSLDSIKNSKNFGKLVFYINKYL